jgi:hypothetical protein
MRLGGWVRCHRKAVPAVKQGVTDFCGATVLVRRLLAGSDTKVLEINVIRALTPVRGRGRKARSGVLMRITPTDCTPYNPVTVNYAKEFSVPFRV